MLVFSISVGIIELNIWERKNNKFFFKIKQKGEQTGDDDHDSNFTTTYVKVGRRVWRWQHDPNGDLVMEKGWKMREHGLGVLKSDWGQSECEVKKGTTLGRVVSLSCGLFLIDPNPWAKICECMYTWFWWCQKKNQGSFCFKINTRLFQQTKPWFKISSRSSLGSQWKVSSHSRHM